MFSLSKLRALFKKDLEKMFAYFVFVNLNIYSRIGFPKKFQSCNLRDENMGFFQARLKLQSTLPGWMFVVINQTISVRLPNILKRRHILHWILLFLVFFELNNNIFFNVKDIKSRLIPLAIQPFHTFTFSPTSKRHAEISVQLFWLRFFI